MPSAAAETTPSQRDEHIQMIQDKGRLAWQKAVGRGRRSLVVTAMSGYKTVLGRGLHARTLPAQKTETRVACSALNWMTSFGMPVSQRIARQRSKLPHRTHSSNCALSLAPAIGPARWSVTSEKSG
jgi:hypothetical protein